MPLRPIHSLQAVLVGMDEIAVGKRHFGVLLNNSGLIHIKATVIQWLSVKEDSLPTRKAPNFTKTC